MTALPRRELTAFLGLAALAGSFGAPDAQAATPDEGARVTRLFQQKLPNMPGKSLTLIAVDYAPGAASKSHRHHASADILAYVVAGAIHSAVEGGEDRVYQAGECWFEPPGAHHTVSANASATAPARLLAFIVADDGAVLTTYEG